MKFTTLIALFLSMFLIEKPTSTPPTSPPITMCGMDQFAKDPSFMQTHPYVRAIPTFEAKGKMIQIPVEGGEKANVYEIKAQNPSNQYMVIIHEWWGLNENIKQQADRLAKDLPHVNMLAVDMYDGKVATTPQDARTYMGGLDQNRALAIVHALSAYMGDEAEVATIGWCFGGAWSLQSALALGEKIKGCVMYYGMPERSVEKLKALNSDVLGIFAKKDRYITPAVVEVFEENMEKAGKEVSVHQFDADHAFANPSGARYQEKEAEEAYALTLAYLKEHLPAE
ncbi:MAG: dienelactone hydrolase family protein [Bacteroidota bacterium]